jgi:putative transposase
VVSAVELRITWEELLDLIDLTICEYNAAKLDSLGHRSRLDCIREELSSDDWLPRRLPSSTKVDDLDTIQVHTRVLGNVKKGRRPYINLWNARYTSPILADSPHLIGQELTIFARESDPRTVRAYLPYGRELGFLTAMGPWGINKHSRGLRTEIARAHERGELRTSLNDPDIIAAYMRVKQENALKEKADRKSKRPKISNEATALARAIDDTGMQPPIATPPDSPGPPRATSPISLPSFVPKISHKSTSR